MINILYFFCNLYLRLLFSFFLYILYYLTLTHFLDFVFLTKEIYFDLRYSSFNLSKSQNFLIAFLNIYFYFFLNLI